MEKINYIGTATDEQIAEWKQKHGEIFAVKVDKSVCYLKKPTRATLSAMSTLGGDSIRCSEFLINNCWLGGDENIKTDDGMFLGVAQQLGSLIEVKSAQLERL